MDFTYGSAFTVDSPDAYETLILDAMLGDASLFTRADEVEAAWWIVTPILEAWLDMPPPEFPNYPAGSWGPPEADELIERDGPRVAPAVSRRAATAAERTATASRSCAGPRGPRHRRDRARAGQDLGESRLTTPVDGEDAERRVAARTSVMNLVVIARRAEVGERCAAIDLGR